MSARALLALFVLLVVLGGGALLYQRQQANERPRNADVLGKPLLKDLRAADVATISISEPKSALTVQRKDEGWVIAERDGFPADVAKVRGFVIRMLELKIGQSMPLGDKERARLNLDDSGTRLKFDALDGKPLAGLIVGKKYFKRDVENPDIQWLPFRTVFRSRFGRPPQFTTSRSTHPSLS